MPKPLNELSVITWFKNEKELSRSWWSSSLNDDGDYSIHLRSITKNPSGNYLCIANFPSLDKTVQIKHNVYKIPAIISKPTSIKIDDGKTKTTFDCIYKVPILTAIGCILSKTHLFIPYVCVFFINVVQLPTTLTSGTN